MAVTHASQIGIEACIRRARDSLYWPRMTTELKEYIAKCDVCLSNRDAQCKEPLQQHEFVGRPWSRVAADLCTLDSRTLLVVSDYYSNRGCTCDYHIRKGSHKGAEGSLRKIWYS